MQSQTLQLVLVLLTSYAQAQEQGNSEPASSTADACASSLGFYDVKLHIAAIFMLLVSSGVGVFLPLILEARAGTSSNIERIFFAGPFI